MQRLKLETAKAQIKDGKFECMTDLKIGYIEIRKANGKRVTIEIVK